MADQPQSAAPQGLETKDAPVAGGRDSVIEHRSAAVPHANLTGTQLTEQARKASFAAVGSPAQGDGVQNTDTVGLGQVVDNADAQARGSADGGGQGGEQGGVGTQSGGTQEAPALGSAKNEGVSKRRGPK